MLDRAKDIALLEVIEAVEGDSRRTTCVLRGGPCGQDGHCQVHDVFFAAQDALLRRLSGVTLAALAGGSTELRTRVASRSLFGPFGSVSPGWRKKQ